MLFSQLPKKYRPKTFGFYEVKGDNVVDFPAHSRNEGVISFLKKIKLNNQVGRILIVLDNFKLHHAKSVIVSALLLGIHIVFYPPYFPDLDPKGYLRKAIKDYTKVIY
ncbi:MAG: transposase [Candidatus Parvarchaeota archaeon]